MLKKLDFKYTLEVLVTVLYVFTAKSDHRSLQVIYVLIIFFIPSHKVQPIFKREKQICDIHSDFKMAIASNVYQSPWVAWRLQIFVVRHWYYSLNKWMLISTPLKGIPICI